MNKKIFTVARRCSPLAIPQTQETVKTKQIATEIISHTSLDWGMPNSSSIPAPTCMTPTPIELETAPHRQKISKAWIIVANFGMGCPNNASNNEPTDRLFFMLYVTMAKATAHNPYMEYWMNDQSHIAWAIE